MLENNRTENYYKNSRLASNAATLRLVNEAARLAHEMGVGGEELGNLSAQMGESGKYDFAYVLALAAAQGLEGKNKAGAYANAGNAAHSIGKLIQSEERYKKAIASNPKHALAHNGYAVLLEELGRKTEAEELYKKAIELDPKFTAAHNNYAVLLIELNRKIDAEKHYKKALELDPKSAAVHNNYADLLRETARFSEAEKEVRIALRIEPTNPYALGTLGDILADEDYLEEAIEEYQAALKYSDSMKPSAASETRNNFGRAYALLGLYNKAEKEFEEAP